MKKEIKIEAGSEINSRCLKCKDITNHTVIAMVDGKIAKVECNVCDSRHNYRPEKPENPGAEKRKATRAASMASAKLVKAEAHYDDLLASLDQSKAAPYSMTAVFNEGDLVEHPTFGMGIVVETVMPNKIDVLFRQENRLLICGRLCK